MHKMCITGGSFIPGSYLKGDKPPHYPVPAIPIECWVCWGTDQHKPYAYVDIVRNNGDESFTLINELAKAPLPLAP